MERYSVNRRSKRTNSVGLFAKWRKKYVGGFLTRRSWITSGYDLNNASYVINRRYSRDKMSPVCHNFVQNAWKKDFCSNCFKSREEHVKHERQTETSKFSTTSFTTRNTFFKKTPPSILKIHPKKKNKRNVRFPEEVCSVIGFGGDDWSDGEEFEMSEDNDEEDTFPETEEERELYKITKSNTDFNTVKANLLGDSTAKSYTSLLLGKMQTDSAGKKKTLLVSVTPFGQENKPNNVKSHTRKPAVINIADTPAEETTTSNYKTNIILSTYVKETETIISADNITTAASICTEKSLLEEISETLEQNRRTTGSDFNLSHKENTKPTVVEEQMKESMSDEPEKKDTNETKKNGLVRKSPLNKTQERPKVNLSRSEFKFCKINIESSSVDSAVSTLNSTANNSLASDDESLSARTDSDNDDSGHFSETHKCEETVKIKVFNDNDKSVKMSPIGQLRKADGQPSGGYSTFQSPIMDLPPILPKQPDNIFSAEASRELAGEPDGRADPDETTEAPALPKSPIPTLDPRPSFLHGMISDIMPAHKPALPEKPKLPVKPVIKQTNKKSNTPPQMSMQPTIKTNDDIMKSGEEKSSESDGFDDKSDVIYYAQPVLTKQDSDSSLSSLSKRKAPTPPTSPTVEEYPNIYQRNSNGFMKSDSPVVREMEKRERATISSMPKSKTTEGIDTKKVDVPPEPAPRRNISLSHDNLLLDDKRKGKLKFSIKKLLRIGSSKDLDKKEITVASVTKISKSEDIYDLTPRPKPRLVIIHPLDINGSNVEVVKSNCEITELRRLSHDDVSSIYSGSSSATDPEIPKVLNKPPPPPRHSSEEYKTVTTVPKPARPPPPKSDVLQKKQKQQAWTTTGNKTDNIYANLGEIRSALAPRKPERTASMREREAHLELPKRRTPIDDDKDDDDDGPQELVQATNETVIHNYDDVYNSAKYDEENCDSAKNSDSDYEYVHHARSSSPECDAAIKPRENCVEIRNDARKSDTDNSVGYNNGIFNRTSLPYCGSETESEIYSPYSFYSSNDNMDNTSSEDYQNDTPKTTTNKLRVRKGRSVVHKNLEDNYGAVVIANHEALAQVLEQVQQSATMQPSLRGLKACTNLRWNDFSIQSSKSSTRAGKRVFYPAIWNSNQGPVNVTLMMYKEQMASQIVCQQSVQPQTLSLNAITEFCDLVPLQQFGEDGDDLVQATIVVLAPAQIDTIQSYGESLHSTEGLTKDHQLVQTEQIHEAIFMMLQLINGLKCLQARGVEDISESLTTFISLKEVQSGNTTPVNEDRLSSLSAPKTNSYGRLCILQGLSDEMNCNKMADEEQNSLCKCAIKALQILLPGDKLTPLLNEILQEERAISLNQAKSVLEFMLWGPLDVVQGVPVQERELSLQRWLDLERATVLHGLVRTRVQLNVFEQLHLMFLVRSTAKAMCDASVLLEKASVY